MGNCISAKPTRPLRYDRAISVRDANMWIYLMKQNYRDIIQNQAIWKRLHETYISYDGYVSLDLNADGTQIDVIDTMIKSALSSYDYHHARLFSIIIATQKTDDQFDF